MMAEPLAENVMQSAINTEKVAYCPAMDLIALTTVDGPTNVYRLNGQKVFGVTSKEPTAKVRGIHWKPNGKTLTTTAIDEFCLWLCRSITGCGHQ